LDGVVLEVGESNLGNITIFLVAEVAAMRAGILMVVQAGIKDNIVEGDNVIIIQAV